MVDSVDGASTDLASMNLAQLMHLAIDDTEKQQMVSSHILARIHNGLLAFHLDSNQFRMLLAETDSVIGGSFVLKIIIGGISKVYNDDVLEVYTTTSAVDTVHAHLHAARFSFLYTFFSIVFCCCCCRFASLNHEI